MPRRDATRTAAVRPDASRRRLPFLVLLPAFLVTLGVLLVVQVRRRA